MSVKARHVVIQPLDPFTRLIPLTKNQNAIVDTSDYDWLMQRNWLAQWDRHTRSFYARSSSRLEGVLMHRMILNAPRNLQVDHINHDTLDNRRSNLRLVSGSQNACNRSHPSVANKSGFKGVSWHAVTNKWQAQIKRHGTCFYLGCFDTPQDAAIAYGEAAQLLK